jgi:hypothetical protein
MRTLGFVAVCLWLTCGVASAAVPSLPRGIPERGTITADLDGDGSPERIGLVHDQPGRTGLVVERRAGRGWTPWLTAATAGDARGAELWVLAEQPRQVLFLAGAGACGSQLLRLETSPPALVPVVDSLCLTAEPQVEDVDGDGHAEVFVKADGGNRSTRVGAALYHWDGERYRQAWPDWQGLPYPLYAVLEDLDRDGAWEILAVLEPEAFSERAYVEGWQKGKRLLGAWSVVAGGVRRTSQLALPDAEFRPEPTFARVRPGDHGGRVRLGYHSGEVQCFFEADRLQREWLP